jgi:hypothetical protein
MGLKGYRLWVMGQLHSNVQRPTAALKPPADHVHRELHRVAVKEPLAVAVPAAFESSNVLKPVSHLIGSRVETRRFQGYGSIECNLYTAPPRPAPRPTRAPSCPARKVRICKAFRHSHWFSCNPHPMIALATR